MDVDKQSDVATTSSPRQQRPLSPTTPINEPLVLMTLPTEILLQILHLLPLPLLLAFRLVCKQANTLVLEPLFWQRLDFSKQLLFKTGGGIMPYWPDAKTTPIQSTRTDSRQPTFQHHSDANLVIHRQSFAAALLSPTSRIEDAWSAASETGAGLGDPTLSVSTNITNFPTSTSTMRRASKSSDWKTIEKSFLLFVTRLASMTRTAHNVRIIHIQDWEGTQTMQELWKVLKKFDGLQSLSIQKSALQYLYDSNDGLEAMEPSWPELWDLSFQDCDRLLDLEGIQIWLSHLVNLNLSGCTNIKSFKPLLYDLYSSPCFTTSSPCILKSLSLNHTLVSNTDLYVLLKRSPELEELRLDQCYNLTVRALEIIGFGRQDPPNTLHGNFAQSTQGTEAGEGSVISPPTESMDSSLDSQLAPPFHLTFIDTQDHHNELSSSTSSQSLPVPITAGSDSPSATATASHSLYSGSFVPQLRKLSLRDCSDLTDQAIRLLVGCRRLEWLVIRGIRQVDEDTAEWLHSQGVPLRKLLSPLGRWRYWHD